MFSKSQQHIGIFLLILLVAILSRFYGLDRLSLWADELWAVVASVSGSLSDMVMAVYYHDNHPPGHYLLLRYTQFFIGETDFAIRLPSALAGVALVAATYLSGRTSLSTTAALIASALVAGSYQAIYYSQEARPNIFVALLALLAFHYFRLVMLDGDRRFKNYCWFWVSASVCSYFHYAGLVFCGCLGLVALVVFVLRRKKTELLAIFKLFVPPLLLYLPWLFGTLQHLLATPVTSWQRPPDINTLKTTFNFLFGPDDLRITFYLLMLLASSVVVVGSAVVFFLNKKTRLASANEVIFIMYTLAMIVLPVAVFYFKSVWSQDAYNHRHFLYAIPLLALLAGLCFDLLARRFSARTQTILLLAALLLIVIYQALANYNRALYRANHFKQEFRETAQVLAGRLKYEKNDQILIVSNTVFFDHYLRRFTETKRKSDFVYETQQKLPELSRLIDAGHISEFYYLEAPIIPGANNMITAEDMALAKTYQPLCRTRFSRAQLFKFSVMTVGDNNDLFVLPDCRVKQND